MFLYAKEYGYSSISFFIIFTKQNNISDYQFALMEDEALPQWSILKGKTLISMGTNFSLRIDLL